jgi:hypothetical protein
MRQKTINLRNQGSFDKKKIDFFPDLKSHTQMGLLRAKNASEKFSRLGTFKSIDVHYLEAEFLEEIQTKVLRVFLLAIQSHLDSCALSFLFLQTHATSCSFCKRERRLNLIGNPPSL